MPKNRIIISIAVLVALLPILGFSRGVEAFFQVVAGLGIILTSVWSNIDRRLSMRAKAAVRKKKKLEQEISELNERMDERHTPGTILDRAEFNTSSEELAE